MALEAGDLIEVQLQQQVFSGIWYNTFQYRLEGSVPVAGAVAIAEGWWNHVKTTQRALVTAPFGSPFKSVKVRELNNPAGEFAEWDIPVGEQAGTRSAPVDADLMPPMVAAGARLTVATRLTRSGQKRMGYLTQTDSSAQTLTAGYITLFSAWLNVVTSIMTLGAPAPLCALHPIVTRKDAQGTVLAHQDVVGYVINPYTTTQNSRKIGRGI
jgi:hypothetical protein